jgi:L-threonylcarbamoyladenylate synthase
VRLIDASLLSEAVDAVNNGELVIVPTERWYMICANASNAEACDRIFTAKQRPTSKPLAFVVRSFDNAQQLFVIHPAAQLLCQSFWPGNLAVLLPWRHPTQGAAHASVGAERALVTCAPGVLGQLAATASVPVAATTVNVSGNAGGDGSGPAITITEVGSFVSDSGIDVAVCIDGGVCPAVSHLTIVDCSNATPSITRTGLVHERAISATLSQS